MQEPQSAVAPTTTSQFPMRALISGGANDHILDAALMAGLIVMQPLGTVKQRNFDRFMADAGMLEILGIEYPRMQILTVGEIIDGQRFKTPTVAGRHTPQPRMPGIPAVGV